jgi:hypothetical protein
MQHLDAQTSTQLARERHVQLTRDYASRKARADAAPRSGTRRRRLAAALRPRAA